MNRDTFESLLNQERNAAATSAQQRPAAAANSREARWEAKRAARAGETPPTNVFNQETTEPTFSIPQKAAPRQNFHYASNPSLNPQAAQPAPAMPPPMQNENELPSSVLNYILDKKGPASPPEMPNSAINSAMNMPSQPAVTKPYQSEVLTQEEDRRNAQARYHEELQLQIKLKEQQKANDTLKDPGFLLGNKPNLQEEAKKKQMAAYQQELQQQMREREQQKANERQQTSAANEYFPFGQQKAAVRVSAPVNNQPPPQEQFQRPPTQPEQRPPAQPEQYQRPPSMPQQYNQPQRQPEYTPGYPQELPSYAPQAMPPTNMPPQQYQDYQRQDMMAQRPPMQSQELPAQQYAQPASQGSFVPSVGHFQRGQNQGNPSGFPEPSPVTQFNSPSAPVTHFNEPPQPLMPSSMPQTPSSAQESQKERPASNTSAYPQDNEESRRQNKVQQQRELYKVYQEQMEEKKRRDNEAKAKKKAEEAAEEARIARELKQLEDEAMTERQKKIKEAQELDAANRRSMETMLKDNPKPINRYNERKPELSDSLEDPPTMQMVQTHLPSPPPSQPVQHQFPPSSPNMQYPQPINPMHAMPSPAMHAMPNQAMNAMPNQAMQAMPNQEQINLPHDYQAQVDARAQDIYRAKNEQKDLIEYIAQLKAEAQLANEEKEEIQKKLESQIRITEEAGLRAMHQEQAKLREHTVPDPSRPPASPMDPWQPGAATYAPVVRPQETWNPATTIDPPTVGELPNSRWVGPQPMQKQVTGALPPWSSAPLDDPEALMAQSLASDSKWVPVESNFQDISMKGSESNFVPVDKSEFRDISMKDSDSKFVPVDKSDFRDISMKGSDSQFVPVSEPDYRDISIKSSDSQHILVEEDIRNSSVKASVNLEPYNPNAEFAQSLTSSNRFVPLAPTPTKLPERRLEVIEESKVEEYKTSEVNDTKLKNAISVADSFMSVPDVNTTQDIDIPRPPTGLDSNGAAELKRLDDMLFSYLNDQPRQFK